MSSRLSIDVGGTFTDLIFRDSEGRLVVGKGATTPAAPNVGVASLVRNTLSAEQLDSVSHFLHGTTVGLNALLERRGAKVGLLATHGFRDSLELGRGTRGNATYDILWRGSEPLVPRHLRLPVRGRMNFDGTVKVPLHAEDVHAAAEAFMQEGVESVAIAFLHAIVNSEHELEAAAALRAAGFAGAISMSHVVSGEIGIYERSSTTAIDAYVRPLMSEYLQDLETDLQGVGVHGACLISRSGGGVMPFAEAETRPFEAIISGPVAGAVGAARLCASRGVGLGITADVGGTSFDTCLIRDGVPQEVFEGAVDGMPIQSPWVDVRAIGAGGGSLAQASDGLLRVGPESAGASPGPVSYGRGGTVPTVTDAAVCLGMFSGAQLSGGLVLDETAARDALSRLSEQIGLGLDRTAAGVMEIAATAMAEAIRTVTIEQGEDPRAAVLVSYGGAGPLFGTLLADELDIAEILVPVHAGNFSAVGLLEQDVARSGAKTLVRPLDDAALAEIGETARSLFDELARRGGQDDAAGTRTLGLGLRYTGQLHTLTVTVPIRDGQLEDSSEAITSRFRESYTRVFGHTFDEPVEVVAVRATLTESAPHGGTVTAEAPSVATGRQVEVYSFRRHERTSFALRPRSSLEVGHPVPGPLIITEPTTTTYVDSGFSVESQSDGTMTIRNLEVPR